MKYPVQSIGWLYDILENLEWRITPLEILDTETQYPGLMGDLSIEAWQRRLVKKQLEDAKPGGT